MSEKDIEENINLGSPTGEAVDAYKKGRGAQYNTSTKLKVLM
jgi:hypothetical protein